MSTFAAFMKSLALILHNGKASLGKTSEIYRAPSEHEIIIRSFRSLHYITCHIQKYRVHITCEASSYVRIMILFNSSPKLCGKYRMESHNLIFRPESRERCHKFLQNGASTRRFISGLPTDNLPR